MIRRHPPQIVEAKRWSFSAWRNGSALPDVADEADHATNSGLSTFGILRRGHPSQALLDSRWGTDHLDGVRAAVLLVVLFHAGFETNDGYVGVMLSH